MTDKPMTDDLVERLRVEAGSLERIGKLRYTTALLVEAADELVRLREGIRQALPDLLVVRESGDVFDEAWEDLRQLVDPAETL